MKTIDIIQIISIVASSTIAIWALIKTNRTAKKLASKEHELAEGIKSDILQLIGTFTSIRYKTILAPNLLNDVSFDDEISAIRRIKLTSGYVFLKYRMPKDDQKMFELLVQLMTERNNTLSNDMLDGYSESLISIISKLADNKELSEEIQKIIKTMCEDVLLNETSPQIPNEFERFVYYLIENGITDPDVRLFQGVFKNDVNIIQKALDEGADRKCTDKALKEKYRIQYASFKKEEFKSFIKYLIEKGNQDPNVKMFFGVINSIQEIVKKAINEGADPNYTDIMIITKYKNDFVEFLISRNNK